MSAKKYTLEEIRNDPDLRSEVCDPDDDNDSQSSSGGDVMDFIFGPIDAAMDATFDGIDAAMDATFDGIDAAMGGTSEKDKK